MGFWSRCEVGVLPWCPVRKDPDVRSFSDSDSRWCGIPGRFVFEEIRLQLQQPHGPRVRVRDPEDRPAQPQGPAGRRPRPRRPPRPGPHGAAVPAGDRGGAQHPSAAEPAGAGKPRGRGDLHGGRADAALPGRVRRLPRHVPAHPGDDRCGGGRRDPAVLRVQHGHLPARVGPPPLPRRLRLAGEARASL